MNKIEKLKNVEFLRFVFIIFIILFHMTGLNGSLAKSFMDEIPLYHDLVVNSGFVLGYFCVEFFFVISGFFLLVTTNFSVSLIDFAKKKIMRMWPVIAFSLVLYWIFSLFTPLIWKKYANIYSFLLLNNVGITTQSGNLSTIWFVSALFWTLLYFFFIIKYISRVWVNFIVAITTVLSFAFIIHWVGIKYTITNNYYIFNFGVMRAIACIGLGYFIGVFYLEHKSKIQNYVPNLLKNLIYTATELYLFLFLMYHFTIHRIKAPDIYMIYIFAFSALFWLFIICRGYFSRLLNNDISVILGRYAYSIFVIQYMVLDLFKVYLWQPHRDFIIHYPVLNLILPILASIVLGVITYHLVEKPSAEYLKKKWFPKNSIKYPENQLPELVLPRGGG